MQSYVVQRVEQASPTTLLLTLQPRTASDVIAYQPGQYAAIVAYPKGRPTPARCFSLVSGPGEGTSLQFAIRVGGRFTKALSRLRPGDRISVLGPFGSFIVDPVLDRDLVLIAGGIGIAPIMSMLRTAAAQRDPRKITVLYGVRSQDDIPFHAELVELARRNPNIEITYAISRGAIDALATGDYVGGRIDNEMLRRVVANGAATFFLCGPPSFIRSLAGQLKNHGVGDDYIRQESFRQGQAAKNQGGLLRDLPFNIYALSGLGILLGTATVMAFDILKILPANFLSGDTQDKPERQDIESFVNDTPPSPTPSASPTSSAGSVSAPSSSQTTTQQSTQSTTRSVSQPRSGAS
jgi:ferredoxin-NADP reductase